MFTLVSRRDCQAWHAWAPETDAPVPPRLPSDGTVVTVPEKQVAALSHSYDDENTMQLCLHEQNV